MASWEPIHKTGTVAVANGGTTVTGVGTNWNVAGIRAGDLFANASLSAMSMITADPTTPTSLAIEAWPGSALSPGSPYKIIRLPDADRIIEANAQLMQNLVPNLTALGGLSGAANKMPYFSGAGAMSLTDLTPAARAILALSGSSGAKVPVVTAAGAAVLRNILGTVSQSGGGPTGDLMEVGNNANGYYERYASGLAICQIRGTYDTTSTGTQVYTSPAVMVTTVGLSLGGPTNNNAVDLTAWKASNPTIHLSTGGNVNIRSQNGAGSIAAVPVSIISIGRWF